MTKTIFSILTAGLLLTGCAYKSNNVSKQGTVSSESELVFPDPKKAWITGGTYKDLTSIGVVQSGMSKVQVEKLIGHPHFNEGFFLPKEWDYLFNVIMDDKSIKTCQFKVIFDKNKNVGSTHWKPKDCVEYAKLEKEDGAKLFTVSADVLFGFDNFKLSDLGKESIKTLLSGVPKGTNIEIIGYTDPIGSQNYNLNLSLKRAQSVEGYLNSIGFSNTTSVGMGAENQIVFCDKGLSREKAIKCLAPNRRVEIAASDFI